MTLVDAGPLVAIIHRHDALHELCVDAAKALPKTPLTTTWPCFVEAMHLLYRRSGHHAQAALWDCISRGDIYLHTSSDLELPVMECLMAKYADLPMDLADASLIAAAEAIGERRIFTLDYHFRVYRFADGTGVEVIP